jgi:hypothetical protein
MGHALAIKSASEALYRNMLGISTPESLERSRVLYRELVDEVAALEPRLAEPDEIPAMPVARAS